MVDTVPAPPATGQLTPKMAVRRRGGRLGRRVAEGAPPVGGEPEPWLNAVGVPPREITPVRRAANKEASLGKPA